MTEFINPLDSKINYSATSNNTKLVHWPPPSPLLAVPNVTAHPSTASVPITVLLYDGPWLCGFNVAIKGLKFAIRLSAAGAHVRLFTSDNGGGKCDCPRCLSVCLLARLRVLKNACMDLDDILRVDRCRNIDELINFSARSGS